MTFYASEDKLETVGLGGKVADINRNAVRIAREVAAEGDALVAGNLSLTWAYDPADDASPDHVRRLLDAQLQGQIDAGPPDFWIGETFSYLGEALLFVERANADRPAGHGDDVVREAPAALLRRRRPGRRARGASPTRAPTSWASTASTRPAQQLPIAVEMVRGVAGDVPVAAQPVAYATTDAKPDFTSWDEFPFELTPMTLARGELARFAARCARGRRAVHRLVLRLGRRARARDGQGAGQGAGEGTRVAFVHRQGDVRLRVLRPRCGRRRNEGLVAGALGSATQPARSIR